MVGEGIERERYSKTQRKRGERDTDTVKRGSEKRERTGIKREK